MITDIVAIVPLIAAPVLPRTMRKPAPGNTVDNIEIRALYVVVLYQNLLDHYREVGMAQVTDRIVKRLIKQNLVANADICRPAEAEALEQCRRRRGFDHKGTSSDGVNGPIA